MEIYSSLGEQSSTWASISEYTSKIQAKMSDRGRSAVRHDNLVGVESIIQSEEDVVVDALKTIPGDHVHQIGVVVFDLKGVVAVELFDSPDSWKAFSQSIIRSYREVLTEEAGDLIEIRTDRAKDVLERSATHEHPKHHTQRLHVQSPITQGLWLWHYTAGHEQRRDH